MKILEELYLDENLYDARLSAVCRQEIRDVDKKLRPLYDQFYDGLSDSQQELFRKTEELFNQRNSIEQRHSFLTGFRLAAQIFAEALTTEL